jgi:hypothetical protein
MERRGDELNPDPRFLNRLAKGEQESVKNIEKRVKE